MKCALLSSSTIIFNYAWLILKTRSKFKPPQSLQLFCCPFYLICLKLIVIFFLCVYIFVIFMIYFRKSVIKDHIGVDDTKIQGHIILMKNSIVHSGRLRKWQ